MKYRPLAGLLLIVGLAACSTKSVSLPALHPTQTGRMRLHGSVTLYNTQMGNQSVDWHLIYAELYGMRADVLGPAGTALLLAVISGQQFEVYSAPDRAMIRDRVGVVIENMDRDLSSMTLVTLAALAAYGTGFGPSAVFESPVRKPYGYLIEALGQNQRASIQWHETNPGNPLADHRLEQLVIDTGYSFVYADRQKSTGTYRVHFGDQVPLLDIDIQSVETDFTLQDIQWQLLVPPGSDVFTFRQYLQQRPSAQQR